MSIRLHMLQVARLAPNVLGDATDLVIKFLHSRHNPDGGFQDRAGNSDLYYTAFGMQNLVAVRAELPVTPLQCYLETFGSGESLDFVHLCCLARCWSLLPAQSLRHDVRDAMIARIESRRSADGGYAAGEGAATGTLYGCFLAVSACQDILHPIARPEGIVRCVESLKAADGGYANQHDLPMGLTPSTAAAVTLLHQFDGPMDPALGGWLLARSHPQGGFFATPSAPIPDLLSTATALHALATLKTEFGPIRDQTLDFIDTLWSSQGGFFGNWEDDVLDCEYLYYGLLALGHLSL